MPPAWSTPSTTTSTRRWTHVDTFADGIAVKTPGETTYEMVSQYVDDVVTVSEDEIAAAILALMENQKLVAEGAGATPGGGRTVQQAAAGGRRPSA